MARYRKKPVEVAAHQWFENGDHPDDNAGRWNYQVSEGEIVRYFRHPDIAGSDACSKCGTRMDQHGWIDTIEDGHTVCPGDWIITGIQGEFYPCKPDIFAATYEPVESRAATDTEAHKMHFTDPDGHVHLTLCGCGIGHDHTETDTGQEHGHG